MPEHWWVLEELEATFSFRPLRPLGTGRAWGLSLGMGHRPSSHACFTGKQ